MKVDLRSLPRLARRALRFAGARLARWAPDQRVLAGILRTAAIDTEPAIPENPHLPSISIHVLTNDTYLLPAIWSLKSFLLAARQPLPITVHLQGSHVRDSLEILPRHFPQARLISQDTADDVVEPWLRHNGLERLRAMRRELFLLQKLVDVRLFAVTPWLLLIDTDVLFFRTPSELLELRPNAPDLFLRDDHPSYCISPQLALAEFGVRLVPFANAGLMRRHIDGMDLRECDQFLANPRLSQPHWHLEQTLHALDASRTGRLQLLPDQYAMGRGFEECPDLVARHYVTPIRPLLVQEGVRHLKRKGFPAHLR